MSAHRFPSDLHQAPVTLADPGASGSIIVSKSPTVCNLVSADAESRTLARPTVEGARVLLHMRTDGGDITLTVTGGYNEDGDTTFTFSDPGQWASFESFLDSSGVYFWRKTSDYSIGNMDPADLVNLESFSGLTATVTELNNYCDASGRMVPVTGSTTITPAAHSGKIVILTSNGDVTMTLPAMTGTGDVYKFALGVDLSSKTMVIAATAKHLFGAVLLGSDDTVGTTLTFNGLVVSNNGGATSITLNGSTQGGRKGDWIEIIDGASSVGLVSGILTGSGTEATPFS